MEEVKKEERRRVVGGKREEGGGGGKRVVEEWRGRRGWGGREREKRKGTEPSVVSKFLYSGLALPLSSSLSPSLSFSPAMSRLRWMPCHPVISPYQPRNCLETSTALSDDAQLLSSFRVPRIIFDRSADRSAIVGEGMGRGF